MKSETAEKEVSSPNLGRNEPCPCGSGKKYKRCHGVGAAPKLTLPKEPTADMAQSMEAFNQIDPNVRDQLMQSLQRLPKGQMQKLQSMIQRGMSGKDISQEAEAFERSLPSEFQEKIKALSASALAEAEGSGESGASMTEEQARALVARAAAEGKISEDQAQSLLQKAESGESNATEKSPEKSKGKFWQGLGKKKS